MREAMDRAQFERDK